RGVVTDRLDVFQVEGDGPHERQDGPHAHFVTETPDRQYLVAVDLGADKLVTLKIDEGKLEQVAECSLAPGRGQRQRVFNETGDYVFIFTELSNEVICASYEDGVFTPEDVYSAVHEDFNGHSQVAAIRRHPIREFLYVWNRGHNSIAVFKVGEA